MVIRRKNKEGVSFYYVDDLNCENTMNMFREYLSNKKLDYKFYPKKSKWHVQLTVHMRTNAD